MSWVCLAFFYGKKKPLKVSGFKTDSQCRALEISRGNSGGSGEAVFAVPLIDATN